jgi:hypothetical protein
MCLFCRRASSDYYSYKAQQLGFWSVAKYSGKANAQQSSVLWVMRVKVIRAVYRSPTCLDYWWIITHNASVIAPSMLCGNIPMQIMSIGRPQTSSLCFLKRDITTHKGHQGRARSAFGQNTTTPRHGGQVKLSDSRLLQLSVHFLAVERTLRALLPWQPVVVHLCDVQFSPTPTSRFKVQTAKHTQAYYLNYSRLNQHNFTLPLVYNVRPQDQEIVSN